MGIEKDGKEPEKAEEPVETQPEPKAPKAWPLHKQNELARQAWAQNNDPQQPKKKK